MPFSDLLRSLAARYGLLEAFRGYFVNTMFDSTFVLMGVIVGLAFSSSPHIILIIGTMLTGALSIGISTGMSVYEAETIEKEIKVGNLEKAMLIDLEETTVERARMRRTYVLSSINFATPLVIFAIMVLPFIFAIQRAITVAYAAYASIGIAISLLFTFGAFLGRLAGASPLKKGARIALLGVIAFVLTGYISSLFG